MSKRYEVKVFAGRVGRGGFGWVVDTRTGQKMTTACAVGGDGDGAWQRLLHDQCARLNALPVERSRAARFWQTVGIVAFGALALALVGAIILDMVTR